MADLLGYVHACLDTGKLVLLAILVSGGIVLQILACALYNNWWPMLSAITYVILPMPLLFFAGSDDSIFSESDNSWVNFTKFLTGFSTIGSIAIPCILKHAGVICWGALAMELSSFFVFVLAIMCFIGSSLGHWDLLHQCKNGSVPVVCYWFLCFYRPIVEETQT